MPVDSVSRASPRGHPNAPPAFPHTHLFWGKLLDIDYWGGSKSFYVLPTSSRPNVSGNTGVFLTAETTSLEAKGARSPPPHSAEALPSPPTPRELDVASPRQAVAHDGGCCSVPRRQPQDCRLNVAVIQQLPRETGEGTRHCHPKVIYNDRPQKLGNISSPSRSSQ